MIYRKKLMLKITRYNFAIIAIFRRSTAPQHLSATFTRGVLQNLAALNRSD
jgi:hypothetical protein